MASEEKRTPERVIKQREKVKIEKVLDEIIEEAITDKPLHKLIFDLESTIYDSNVNYIFEFCS